MYIHAYIHIYIHITYIQNSQQANTKATETLQLRHDMLLNCFGDGSQATDEEHKARWKAFLESQKVQEGLANNEPIQDISRFTAFCEFTAQCNDLVFTGWDQMKTCKSELATKFKDYNDMCGQVNAQANRITALLNRKRDQAQREIERRDETSRTAAAKAVAKAKAKGKAETTASEASTVSAKSSLQVFQNIGRLAAECQVQGAEDRETTIADGVLKVTELPEPVVLIGNVVGPEAAAACG